MARCYSASMRKRHPALPDIWLVSDARNDIVLESQLARLPRGSGLIFRHYHLAPAERHTRFERLARLARKYGHIVVLSGTARQARTWGADGAYGEPARLAGGPAMLRLVTAHSLREIGKANRIRASAILLAPAFPTRSHPGRSALGPIRFRMLARYSATPVIALGGMDSRRARRIGTRKWAAIDGICGEATRRIPVDS